MKNIISLLSISFFLHSCGANTSPAVTEAKDSGSATISEDLPPPTESKQFEWIYSSFAAAACTSVEETDKFIHPEKGVWIITSDGAMPSMKNAKTFRGVEFPKGKFLIPISKDEMSCTPKAEGLPSIDCDQVSKWSKEGCFTTEENVFLDAAIWDHCGLSAEDAKRAQESAKIINRTVYNTLNSFRFYFTFENGSMYLLFIDCRVPCEA